MATQRTAHAKHNARHKRPAAVSKKPINAHSVLVNEILLSLGERGDCRVWKNSSGAMQGADGQYMRFGLPGSPDIIGFTTDGKFLGIECKTGKATQSEKQKNFEDLCWLFSARYLVARDVESVHKFLDWLNLSTADFTLLPTTA